jgi:putative DNA primase/helicase
MQINTSKSPGRSPGAQLNSQLNNRLSLDAVKVTARGQWTYVLSSIGIAQTFLKNTHGPCPICGGKNRFRFDDKDGNGTFICNQCGSGDGFKLIKLATGKPFPEALRLVADTLGVTSNSSTSNGLALGSDSQSRDQSKVKRRKAALNAVFDGSREVAEGDPVWAYLTNTRGIKLVAIPTALRYHPALEYYGESGEPVGTYPAMVAVVEAPDGSAATLHRTYLSPDGHKAAVPQAKKLMSPATAGATKGGAIKLFEPDKRLGVAEGIETALACYVDTKIPTWSTVSAPLMPSLVVPQNVDEIIIFADNDQNATGQKAAKKLAKRLLDEGKRVKLLIPPVAGTDWLDVVTAQAREGAV